MRLLRTYGPWAACLLLPWLYWLHLDADNIAGLFGILWSDEGPYLLSARNAVLFGQPHLFEGDRYIPELTAPLLHYFALLTITQAHVFWFTRIGMGIMVVTASALIAWLASRYHGSRKAGVACFLILMLDPVLFFYARVGLSEGMQYLIMAGVLWALFEFDRATTRRAIMLYAAATAALIGVLFLAKVTSMAACIGLTLAALVAMAQKPQPLNIIIASGLGGFGVFALVLLLVMPGGVEQWYINNFGTTVYNQMVPHSLGVAWVFLRKHFVGLHHFLALMPIFTIGFASLLIAGERKRGYLWILWIATMLMMVVESFFSGELRRSFFGLTMMMVLAGFSIGELVATGVPARREYSRWLSWAMLGAFIVGLGYFIIWAFVIKDVIYIILGVTSALLLGNLLLIRGPERARARSMLVGIACFMSLIPMLYQSFVSPYSLKQVTDRLEKIVPPEYGISGALSPWYFSGMRRPIIFTNCASQNWMNANDIADVPDKYTTYFVTHPQMMDPQCDPDGFENYEAIKEIHFFYPFNRGIEYGGSNKWRLQMDMILFKKPSLLSSRRRPGSIVHKQ